MACLYKYNDQWYSELELKEIYLSQDSTIPSPASNQTVNKVREWLRKVGVDVKEVPYISINGERTDANGVAKIFQSLVEVVEGKQNTALTEEAMHFATYLIRETNPSLYKQMLNRISQYDLYRDVFDTYKTRPGYQKDGKPDVGKIKFEAIGKLLAEYYVQTEEGSTTKPELLEQQKTWIQSIIDWIKNLFTKHGNPFEEAIVSLPTLPSIQETPIAELANRVKAKIVGKRTDSPYESSDPIALLDFITDQLSTNYLATLEQFLDYDEKFAQEILDAVDKQGEFLQVSTDLISKLDHTAATVVNKPTPDENGQPSNAYFIGDKQVKSRVTKVVKDRVKSRFARERTGLEKRMDEQKREWGSRGHRDMQALLGRYLTADGKVVKSDGKLVPQNTNPIKSEIDPMNSGFFDTMHQYAVDLLLSYPEGTVFRLEQTIYSDRGGKPGERDIAGTMDFMAIQPDGKKDILDWKFFSAQKDQKDDIQWYKQNEWNQQMLEYKKILKREYGLKDADFGKTRMIPFAVTYTSVKTQQGPQFIPADVDVASVNLKIDEKTWLLPVATPDESTGNKDLDALISSLTELYNTIKNIPAPDRQRNVKNEQLNNLFKAIRHLQVAKNFGPLTEQIGILIKDSERVIKEHKEKFENLTDLTEEQISAEAANLLLKAQALHIYQNLSVQFRNFYGEKPSVEEIEILAKLDKITSDAREAFADINDIVKEFGAKYIAGRRGVEDLLKEERSVAGLTRGFNTTSELNNAAIQTLFLMVDNANNKIQFELNDVREELITLKKDVDTWGGLKKALPLLVKQVDLKKGKKESDDQYKKRIAKESNKLIDEYDREFYDELKEAMESTDIDWMKSNLDMPALTKHLKERYVEVKKVIEETRYSYDDTENEFKKEEALKKLADTTDITKIDTFIDKDQYHILKKFPLDIWHSEEYKTLQKNAPVFKFYKFIRKWNAKANEVGYLENVKGERNFLPYLYKSFSEKINLGGEFAFGDWLFSSLSIDENVAGYGNYNPLTGQIEDTLPTYFTRTIENPAQISEDLFVNMAAYVKAIINYDQKSQIDGQVKALYFIEQNKASLRVDNFTKIVRVNGVAVRQETNDKNADLLLNHIKSLQYGQKYTNVEATDALLGDWAKGLNKVTSAINRKLGADIIPQVSEGKQVSLTRLMDGINRFFTLKNMGLNVATSASVFMGGNFQAVINSGKYYTKEQFLASEFNHAAHKIIGSNKLHKALIENFMPIDEELQRELNKLAVGTINSNSFGDFMMFMMRKADHIVQYANFLSFMKNTIVVDGKLYNAREYYRNSPEYANRYNLSATERTALESKFDSKVQQLVDTQGIEKLASVDEKGKLTIKGIPNLKNDNLFSYRTLINAVGKRATGNVSPENEMLIRMNAIFRSMLVFKNWIPGLVKQRVGGLRQDKATGTWEYGRLRMLIKHLGPLAIFKVNTITNILKANDKGVAQMKEFFKAQKESYTEATDKDLNMQEAQFMDLFRQNLKNQIKELGILLSMIAIVTAILPLFKPDDDEEMEVKNRFKFASRLLDKVKDEVWFYYNPVGLQQILNGSIFPALGIFTDAARLVTSVSKEIYGVAVNDPEIVEENYLIKNLMKSLPLTKELTYYIAMFNADLAKELGIQISSQSRLK